MCPHQYEKTVAFDRHLFHLPISKWSHTHNHNIVCHPLFPCFPKINKNEFKSRGILWICMVFLCVFNSANKKHIFSQTHFDEGSSSWSSFGRASLGGSWSNFGIKTRKIPSVLFKQSYGKINEHHDFQ